MSKRSRSSRPAAPGAGAPPPDGTPSPTPRDTGTTAPRATSTSAPKATGTTASKAAGASTAAPASARRPRLAPTAPRSPLERYRGRILGALAVVAVVAGGVFVFLGATKPVYACESVLEPAAASGERLGQATRDLGRPHVEMGSTVRYDFCPPTSGPHYNESRFGPVPTRVYGVDDRVDPQGWIHNLEHGQMVVLYRCPEGCDETAQAALRALQAQLPASPLCQFPATQAVPVVRFDEMPAPYAAVVWGRVLFLDSLDTARIATFAGQSADRGPEPQCQAAVPGASAAPTATPAP